MTNGRILGDSSRWPLICLTPSSCLPSFSTPDCLLSEAHSLLSVNLLLEKMFSSFEILHLLLGQVLKEHPSSHCLLTPAAREFKHINCANPAGQQICLVCLFFHNSISLFHFCFNNPNICAIFSRLLFGERYGLTSIQ